MKRLPDEGRRGERESLLGAKLGTLYAALNTPLEHSLECPSLERHQKVAEAAAGVPDDGTSTPAFSGDTLCRHLHRPHLKGGSTLHKSIASTISI